MENGIQTQVSQYSFDETVERVKKLLSEKGIKLFCVIDHSAEAEAEGLQLPDTKVLIFGNAKAGTPLMQAAPSTALDLPLKLLIAESADGKVLLSWNQPAWLQQRHGFAPDLEVNIKVVSVLAQMLAEAST